jgi:hypothetical protein
MFATDGGARRAFALRGFDGRATFAAGFAFARGLFATGGFRLAGGLRRALPTARFFRRLTLISPLSGGQIPA